VKSTLFADTKPTHGPEIQFWEVQSCYVLSSISIFNEVDRKGSY
jgi:hypothetical protein